MRNRNGSNNSNTINAVEMDVEEEEVGVESEMMVVGVMEGGDEDEGDKVVGGEEEAGKVGAEVEVLVEHQLQHRVS